MDKSVEVLNIIRRMKLDFGHVMHNGSPFQEASHPALGREEWRSTVQRGLFSDEYDTSGMTQSD